MRGALGRARCGGGAARPAAARGAPQLHPRQRAPRAPCAGAGGGPGGGSRGRGGSGGGGGGDAPQPARQLCAATLAAAAALATASHARAADEPPAAAAGGAASHGGLAPWRAAAKALSSAPGGAGGGADDGDADVARLRRLTREAFRELLEAKRRIRTLEELTGADNPAAAAAARVAKLSGGAAGAAPGLRLSGRLSAAAGAAALRPAPDAADALRRAGLVSASLLELSLEAPLRLPSAPQLSASAAVAPGGGGAAAQTLRLTRLCVALRASGGRLRLRLLARGGAGADAAACLTPTAGRAASALARGGAAPYRRCAGAGAAAQADVDTPAGGLTLSLATFASSPHSDAGTNDADNADSDADGAAPRSALTLFAAATLRPAPRVAFALAAVRAAPLRQLPSLSVGRLGAFTALPPASSRKTIGEATSPSIASSLRRDDAHDDDTASDPLEAPSTVVSASAAAVLRDTLTLSAWAAAELRSAHQASSSSAGAPGIASELEWGAALAPAPHAAGLRWGLSAGRPLRGAVQAEAFLHCGGGGWTLTPALLALRGRGVAAIVRAHTTF